MAPRSIPDRWLNYKPHGYPVEGTRFIALKVPLKEAICNRLPEDLRFTPETWIRRHPDVDLIIDLTNTNRYYNEEVFTSKGIKYKKIKTEGRVVPQQDIVNKFFNTVEDHIHAYPDSLNFIGVHCTHGVNRTGFFVCSYMIQRLGFRPEEAIDLFEEARGYKIERENYREALLAMKSSCRNW